MIELQSLLGSKQKNQISFLKHFFSLNCEISDWNNSAAKILTYFETLMSMDVFKTINEPLLGETAKEFMLMIDGVKVKFTQIFSF